MPSSCEYWPIVVTPLRDIGLLSISLVAGDTIAARHHTHLHAFEHLWVDRVAAIVEPLGGLVSGSLNERVVHLEVSMLSDALTLQCVQRILGTLDAPVTADECQYADAVLQTEEELAAWSEAESARRRRFFDDRIWPGESEPLEWIRTVLQGELLRVVCMCRQPPQVPGSRASHEAPHAGDRASHLEPLIVLLLRNAIPAEDVHIEYGVRAARFSVRTRRGEAWSDDVASLARVLDRPEVLATLGRAVEHASGSTLARVQHLSAIAPYSRRLDDLAAALHMLEDAERLRSHVACALRLRGLPQLGPQTGDRSQAQSPDTARWAVRSSPHSTSLEIVFRHGVDSRLERMVTAARHRTGMLAAIARDPSLQCHGIIPIGGLARHGDRAAAQLGFRHRHDLPQRARDALHDALMPLMEREPVSDDRARNLARFDAAMDRVDSGVEGGPGR